MFDRLAAEVRAAGLSPGGANTRLVTEVDLDGLPESVQR